MSRMIKMQVEIESVKFEPGYLIRFNRRSESHDQVKITEEEGIISQVKDGGGMVVIVPDGNRFMISFVKKEDVVEICNKIVGD